MGLASAPPATHMLLIEACLTLCKNQAVAIWKPMHGLSTVNTTSCGTGALIFISSSPPDWGTAGFLRTACVVTKGTDLCVLVLGT